MQRRFTSAILASAFSALFLVAVPTLSVADPHHTPGVRQHNQQKRIYQGVHQGQIGPREYRHLQKEQLKTARMRHRFRHNDGHIGPKERARLHHRLNHSNRHIYRARHN
ncbi:MAG: hypothetical protein AB7G75_20880 [Candidatus Binatia bacterium]